MSIQRGPLLLGVLLTGTTACYQGSDADAETGAETGTAGATATDTANPTGGPTDASDDDSATNTNTNTTPPAPTSDEASSEPQCPGNAPPAAPTVLSPGPDRIDITAANLSIAGSPFVDPDAGDVYGGVEAEIWELKDGVPDKRVWHAEIDGAAPPPAITLVDGTFDDETETALDEWEAHVVRLRYRDEHAGCSDWGEWSDDLEFRTDDGSTFLFDDSQVLDFHLEIPPESFDAINAQASPPGCVPFDREYYTGTLKYGDQTFPGVGIKTKGGCGSSRSLNEKASFKINLEWDDPSLPGCPGERRLFGQKHFTFNNGVQDNSATHERVGYALFRAADVPAPRMAHVQVFVNGELWGLYQHVETIDRRFLQRHFESKEGMLYEGTYWCDLTSENLPATDTDDSKCLSREFSPNECSIADPEGDPLDFSQLRAMITAVEALPDGGFYPAITQIFDWDRFLTTWAVESVIAHWDNYAFEIRNNYRVYHDPVTNLWTLLSTGIDQTFNQEQDPWNVHGVLAIRCVAEPACEAAFAARLAEVNDLLESTDYAGQATAIYDQIRPYVEADPRKEYDMGTFDQRHQDLLNFLAARPEQVRTWLSMHGY